MPAAAAVMRAGAKSCRRAQRLDLLLWDGVVVEEAGAAGDLSMSLRRDCVSVSRGRWWAGAGDRGEEESEEDQEKSCRRKSPHPSPSTSR